MKMKHVKYSAKYIGAFEQRCSKIGANASTGDPSFTITACKLLGNCINSPLYLICNYIYAL